MKGSVEFTTWIVLASSASLAGLLWFFTSSLWVLIPAALVGAWLGWKAEALGRAYFRRAPTKTL